MRLGPLKRSCRFLRDHSLGFMALFLTCNVCPPRISTQITRATKRNRKVVAQPLARTQDGDKESDVERSGP